MLCDLHCNLENCLALRFAKANKTCELLTEPAPLVLFEELPGFPDEYTEVWVNGDQGRKVEQGTTITRYAILGKKRLIIFSADHWVMFDTTARDQFGIQSNYSLVPQPPAVYTGYTLAFPLLQGKAVAHCQTGLPRACSKARVGSTTWEAMDSLELAFTWSWYNYMSFGTSTLFMGCGAGASKSKGQDEAISDSNAL